MIRGINILILKLFLFLLKFVATRLLATDLIY